jgi:hypothetical protein
MPDIPQVLFVSAVDRFGAARLPRDVHLAGGRVSVLTRPSFRLSVASATDFLRGLRGR